MPDHARSDDPAVQAQLDRLAALSPGRDTLGLERITALLNRLDNPQHRLPPVFHVAGTNGKGSTCAFLRAMLEAAGHSVHVYTSPHLVRFNERIRLSGTLISDADLASYLTRVLDVAEGLQASFFEVTTAVAFLAFAEHPADACVVEVGLGGRLDATNVIERPLVCGIASLGIDHEAFLLAPEEGIPDMPPLERIAFEKAGIAKAGVPLVTMSYDLDVGIAVHNQAEQAGADCSPMGPAWDVQSRGEREIAYVDWEGYQGRQQRLVLPRPALTGRHQIDNAGLAIAMLRHQKRIAVPKAAMAEGLQNARWSARLQRLRPGPLVRGREIWLDGGHNASAGIEIYLHFFGPQRSSRPPKELIGVIEKLVLSDPMSAAKLLGIELMHLVIGMLVNKDPQAFVGPFSPFLASITAVPVVGHDCHAASAFGTRASSAANVSEALAALPDDGLPVLICGSLYLAGNVLQANDELPD